MQPCKYEGFDYHLEGMRWGRGRSQVHPVYSGYVVHCIFGIETRRDSTFTVTNNMSTLSELQLQTYVKPVYLYKETSLKDIFILQSKHEHNNYNKKRFSKH